MTFHILLVGSLSGAVVVLILGRENWRDSVLLMFGLGGIGSGVRARFDFCAFCSSPGI